MSHIGFRSSRLSALKAWGIASVVAGVGVAAPVAAATFHYKHHVMGMTGTPTPGAQETVAEIVLALTGGPALPAAEVSWPYSYDLSPFLTVTGDKAYRASDVNWTVLEGSLPQGLSLGTDGRISGTPTTKDLVGAGFTVKASYKGKDGQQVFTIVVNGAELHVSQLALGELHTCALTPLGGVKCWGVDSSGMYGASGVLGQGKNIGFSRTPVDVKGLTSGVVSLSAGTYHTCAITATGGVTCWGTNGSGQLGNGSLTASNVPVSVTGLQSGVIALTGGRQHTCALTAAGAAVCWGSDVVGQLGNDASLVDQPAPAVVQGLTEGVTALSAGTYHTCAAVSGGAKCWGYDVHGQLGNDTATANRSTPVDVLGLTAGVATVAAGGNHACALTTGGGLKCWGYDAGQLGNDVAFVNKPTPVNVMGLMEGVTSVIAGLNHTCATTATGLKCWGDNSSGQLGTGNTTSSGIPVAVTGLGAGVTSIATGQSSNHTCALVGERAMCWGVNNFGQLGDNTLTSRSVPTAVVMP